MASSFGNVIRDQRTMTGEVEHRTVDDVVSFWRARAQRHGFERGHPGAPRRLTALRETELESRVYISGGCWVADCPEPLCNGAAACWAENPRACCLDCGTVFTPVWPTTAEIGGELQDVVDVLALRPDPVWRNFRTPSSPDETLAELKAQNLSVGDAIPGGAPAKGPHPLRPTLIRP